ncbi:MAG TPA: hypothetical protein VMD74_04995 [Candidatus Methylomirabilis sp.]|nr:hypothetical protein [Candidatus Methylomirabilis sp.]
MVTCKTYGNNADHLIPLLIKVYGDSAVVNEHQWGYAIYNPSMSVLISSRSLEVAECLAVNYRISKMVITVSDTTTAEWNNCHEIVQY